MSDFIRWNKRRLIGIVKVYERRSVSGPACIEITEVWPKGLATRKWGKRSASKVRVISVKGTTP
jgi:hypothetical protein